MNIDSKVCSEAKSQFADGKSLITKYVSSNSVCEAYLPYISGEMLGSSVVTSNYAFTSVHAPGHIWGFCKVRNAFITQDNSNILQIIFDDDVQQRHQIMAASALASINAAAQLGEFSKLTHESIGRYFTNSSETEKLEIYKYFTSFQFMFAEHIFYGKNLF